MNERSRSAIGGIAPSGMELGSLGDKAALSVIVDTESKGEVFMKTVEV